MEPKSPPGLPSPTTLTLRLKHHRTTALLGVPPTATFTTLKTELLRALRQTHPAGHIPAGGGASTVAIPSDPGAVKLARPQDPLDVSRGWVLVPTCAEDVTVDEIDEAAAGGGSAGSRGGAGEKDKRGAAPGWFENVTQANIKDGAVLAFRFSDAAAGGAVHARRRGEGEGGEVDEGLGMEFDDDDGEAEAEGEGGDGEEQWNVIIPSYEDAAGVVNEGDAGVLKNYDG